MVPDPYKTLLEDMLGDRRQQDPWTELRGYVKQRRHRRIRNRLLGGCLTIAAVLTFLAYIYRPVSVQHISGPGNILATGIISTPDTHTFQYLHTADFVVEKLSGNAYQLSRLARPSRFDGIQRIDASELMRIIEDRPLVLLTDPKGKSHAYLPDKAYPLPE